MHLSRRGLLRATGAVGSCCVAGTALGRGGTDQSDDETWTATYDAGRTEYADAVTRRGDASLLAGRSIEAGETAAYWTLELGPDGERRAVTTFERETRSTVEAVLPAADGAVVVGIDFGPADAVTAPWTPWATRVDGDGVAWTYGKDDVERDHRVAGAARTSGGDYVLVGARGIRDADAWTLRLAADGSAIGEWSPDRDRASEFRGVVAVGDGDVIVGGSVGERGESTASLARLGADGTARWERTYGDADGLDLARVRSIAADGDGFALAIDGVADGDAKPVVARADGEGSLQWTAALFSSYGTAAESVAPVDGGYLVGGNFVLEDSDHDYWLAAVDRDGTERWLARYDGGGYLGDLLDDGSNALFVGSDGDDAVGRPFEPAEAPWQGADRDAADGSATETTAEEAADETTTERSSGDETTEASATTGTPGFGVAEAVAGSAALALIRRRRGD